MGNRKFEKKIGHGYFVGNVFLTIKISNGFLKKSSKIKAFSNSKYILPTP